MLELRRGSISQMEALDLGESNKNSSKLSSDSSELSMQSKHTTKNTKKQSDVQLPGLMPFTLSALNLNANKTKCPTCGNL